MRQCAAALRRSAAGDAWVVYLVPVEAGPPRLLDQLWEQVSAALPVPCSPLFVTALPLNGFGGVDFESLARLPLLDDELARRGEVKLAATPGVAEAALVRTQHRADPPRLHLSRLAGAAPAPGPGAAAPGRPPARPAGGAARPAGGTPRPAHAEGPPLEPPADFPLDLPEALARASRRPPPAGVCHLEPDGTFFEHSYGELLDEARRGLTLLRRRGLAPGRPVLLQLERSRELLPALWACLLGGLLPVPVTFASDLGERNAATEKLENAWRLFSGAPILSTAALRPRLEDWGRARGLAGLEVLDLADAGDSQPAEDLHRPDPEDVALVVLTSGSTGEPKGVMLRHRNILCRTLGKTRHNGLGPDEVSLNWMPLDHVGGIVAFHLRDVVLGARQIHAPTEPVLQDPLTWLDWVDRHRVSVTWAPNFAFGLVNEHAAEIRQRRWDLSCLRFIVNGGEPIVPRTGRRFLELLAPHGLPSSALHPTWGQAEASSGITYSRSFRPETVGDDDALVEVGPPIPGVALRVVDEAGRVLDEGDVGRIQVRGATVMAGYYDRPERTREVIGEDGWLDTGDLGFLRDGRLTVSGRHKETIVVHGASFYCHEVEAAVEDLDGVMVSWTAACAVAEGGREHLAIFFATDRVIWSERLELVRRIRETVVRRVGLRPTHVVPLPPEEIPKTAIGKIQRVALRRRFEAGDFADRVAEMELREGGPRTVPSWFFGSRWDPHAETPGPVPSARRLIVGGGGLGERLQAALADAGGAVLAAPALRFGPVERNRFELDLTREADWHELLDEMAADGGAPVEILFLPAWLGVAAGRGVEPAPGLDEEPTRAVPALLALARVLTARGAAAHGLRILAVGDACLPGLPGDTVRPEKAMLPALLRTLAREVPWLACRFLDVPGPAAAAAEAVLRELGQPADEPEVGWRGGRRWVPRLERLDPLSSGRETPLLRRGGAYLITGGLGGVGAEVARWLLEDWQARLLLVGRTPPDELADGERGEALARLRAIGDVEYAALDVAEEADVEAAVTREEARWGERLSGAFHLAGGFRRRRLAEETAAELAAGISAKVAGAVNLLRLLERRGGGLLVAFSSVAAWFGEAGLGAYAAANAFLDALAVARGDRDDVVVRTVAWSAWSGLGMARGVDGEGLAEATGFLPMPVEAALSSLNAVLHLDRPAWLVGLDATHPAIRRAERRAEPLIGLTAFWSGERRQPLPPLELTDRFGVAADCVALGGPALPRTAGGEVDRRCLEEHGPSGQRPTSPLERAVAACWAEVLQRSDFQPRSHFFEEGGDSLLGVRLLGAMRRELGLELTLRDLFTHPTVAAQAALLAEREAAVPPSVRQPDAAAAAELLDRLDSLSDVDVERLLGAFGEEAAHDGS